MCTLTFFREVPLISSMQAAVENGIPVLHSSFMTSIHQKWTEGAMDLNIAKLSEAHRLPPLHELKICLTGYDFATSNTGRQELVERIADLGGASYSPSMDSSVTHLVIGPMYNTYSDKLQEYGKVVAARQINRKRATLGDGSQSLQTSQRSQPQSKIHIVWGEWLEHSLLAFGRLREENYTVDIIRERQNVQAPVFKRAVDIKSRAASPKGDVRRASKILRQETVLAVQETASFSSASSKKQKTEERLDYASASTSAGLSRKSRQLELSTATHASDPAGQAGHEKDQGEVPETAQIRKERLLSGILPTPSSRPAIKKSRSFAHAELQGIQDLLTPITEGGPKKGKGVLLAENDCKGISSQSPVFTTTKELPGSSTLKKLGDRVGRFSSASTKQTISPLLVSIESKEKSTLCRSTSPPGQKSNPSDDMDQDMQGAEDKPPARIFEGKKFFFLLSGVSAEKIDGVRQEIEERGGVVLEKNGPEVDWILCKTIR